MFLPYNKNYSYAGVTQMLKENKNIIRNYLKVKYTKMVGKGWQYICQVHGFKNKIDALKFEWAVKHCAPRAIREFIIEYEN